METRLVKAALLTATALLFSACATGPHPTAEQIPNAERKLLAHCGAERAYTDGISGSAYRNVCPDEMRDEYEYAYQLGRQVFDLNRRLKVIGEMIVDKQNNVWRVDRDIAALERAMRNPDLSSAKMAELGGETARLRRTRGELNSDLDRLRTRRAIESDTLTGLETGDPER